MWLGIICTNFTYNLLPQMVSDPSFFHRTLPLWIFPIFMKKKQKNRYVTRYKYFPFLLKCVGRPRPIRIIFFFKSKRARQPHPPPPYFGNAFSDPQCVSSPFGKIWPLPYCMASFKKNVCVGTFWELTSFKNSWQYILNYLKFSSENQ